MKKIIVGLLLLVLVGTCWAGETWQITLLHTNDLHGMVLPFDYSQGNSLFAGPDAGGLARRATLVAELRKAIDHPVALVEAGDIFARGPWHQRFFGAMEIAAYKELGYDLLCVGNNEFQATQTEDAKSLMLALMRQSSFPWLAANLTVGDTGVPLEGIHPFIVRRYEGVRVGFLGLTAPRSANYPMTQGWTISDPIEAAQKWAPLARKECDVLIAVTHLGYETDLRLAAQVAGLDAIIGGDSHTFLPAPVYVFNPEGRLVPIVQAGEHGVCLGRLDLTFEKTDRWRLLAAVGELIPVDARLTEDLAVKRLLERWIEGQEALAPAA